MTKILLEIQSAYKKGFEHGLEFGKKEEQWGASSITNPEFVEEQKKKTQELREMLDEQDDSVSYIKEVIEALYENSDPISIEAAELLERIIPKQEQRCYCGNIYRLGVIHREDTFCDERPKPNYDEKKFAEFLIKECLNTIDSKSIFKDETEYEKGHNDALKLIYNELVKKFGIKWS